MTANDVLRLFADCNCECMCDMCNALSSLGYSTEIVHDNWEDLTISAVKDDDEIILSIDPYMGMINVQCTTDHHSGLTANTVITNWRKQQ